MKVGPNLACIGTFHCVRIVVIYIKAVQYVVMYQTCKNDDAGSGKKIRDDDRF